MGKRCVHEGVCKFAAPTFCECRGGVIETATAVGHDYRMCRSYEPAGRETGPSAEERRRVALRLRNNAGADLAWLVPWAVFNDAEEHDARSVALRLAEVLEGARDGD